MNQSDLLGKEAENPPVVNGLTTDLSFRDITRVDLYSYTSEIFATIYDDHGLGLEALAVYTTDLLRSK